MTYKMFWSKKVECDKKKFDNLTAELDFYVVKPIRKIKMHYNFKEIINY